MEVFIGQFGEKAKLIVTKMLENNMVHFLGSDVHKANTIYPKIPEILEELEGIVGKEKLKEITDTNQRLVLENKRIEVDTPTEINFNFKEKLIMMKK